MATEKKADRYLNLKTVAMQTVLWDPDFDLHLAHTTAIDLVFAIAGSETCSPKTENDAVSVLKTALGKIGRYEEGLTLMKSVLSVVYQKAGFNKKTKPIFNMIVGD